MKKILALIMAMVLVVGLAACGGEAEPKHTLSFKGGKLVNMNDNELVGIFFEYTNNSGETAVICDEIDVKAFQNGKQLNVMVYTGQETEGAVQCDTSIQTGTTTDVVWLFERQDDSMVSVECTDGNKYEFEIK